MAGRRVNVSSEVLQVTHNEDLRAVFFTSPGTSRGYSGSLFYPDSPLGWVYTFLPLTRRKKSMSKGLSLQHCSTAQFKVLCIKGSFSKNPHQL